MVAIISVPLVLSFTNMQEIAAVKKQLSQDYNIGGQTQQLRNIKVRLARPLKISADLISTHMPDPQELATLEKQLSKQLGQAV
jgi:hypothetical protein